MKAIQKGTEPNSLVEHRTQAHSHYGNLPADTKQKLRESLVAEQSGVCCYCMGRIRPDATAMKVEHWACQHAHTAQQLSYSNLLGACLGGEGQPKKQQHCDTRKGKDSLQWNPANPAHAVEARIRYEPDGTIGSDDGTFDQQLNAVLNLNLAVLRRSREGIYQQIAQWWKREKARRKGPVPKAVIENVLSSWENESPLRPHCGIAIWALRRKLAKAA